MMDALLGALALMLVLEGLFPFLHPKGWRDLFARVTQLSDGQIRFMGLVSLLMCAVLLYVRA